MKCAQCEKAEATVRCLDEKLEYCDPCCQALHSKKARKHHRLEILAATRLCDECEAGLGEVECLVCGGGQTPLVFCFDCCSSLHSRSARASHTVRKYGSSTLTPMEVFVDLGLVQQNEARGRRKDVGLLRQKAGLEGVIDLTDDSDEKFEATVKVEPQELKRVKSEYQECGKNSSAQIREEFPVRVGSASAKSLCNPKGSSSSPKKGGNLLQCKKERTELQPKVEKVSDGTKNTTKEAKREISEEAPRRTQRVRSTRKFNGMAELDSSEECSSNKSTSDSEVENRGTHRMKRGSVTVEAFYVDATDQHDSGPGHTGEPTEEPVSGIRFKIKKMLELGLHPDTPELEAQQALNNAQRLLTKHNLEQAEVLRGNLTDTSTLTGGMRVVELRAKGRAKLGRMESWVLELGWVISDNFDTQFFFKTGSPSKPLRVVFYGISQNADCAGYAFAATFNRITVMSAEYIGKSVNNYDGPDKENQDVKSRIRSQGINTRVARANYRRGIVAGLRDAVGSRSSNNQPRHENGIKSEGKGCCGADFPSDEEFGMDHPEDDVHSDTPTKFEWRCMAITALVQHSKKVGEDLLQSKGIKVRKRTQQNRSLAWNEDAYAQGKKDAETIDINQKALEDVKAKKRKKTRG